MRSNPVRLFPSALAALVLATGIHAAEPAIVAKARALLGTEAALDSIRSVHFKGNVVSVDPAEPAKESKATLEIMAEKPDRQRVVATSDKTIETTVVDGYEGWQRMQEVGNLKNQRLIIFKPDAVKRLRAQAWENVSFFRGIERQGGTVVDQGSETVDGVACQKVAFVYNPGVVFVRYFDVATGRLVQTLTEDGTITKEEGEIMVNGVRFPKRMLMIMKGAKGQTQNVTVSFESVNVNEPFDRELFRTPRPEVP